MPWRPHDVQRKTRDPGTAQAVVDLNRRVRSLEGKYGVIGAGATVVGATVQTTGTGGNPTNYYPGIVYNSSGLSAYNASGIITMQIDALTGNVTLTGTGIITGGTIQTSASSPRVIMDGAGIRAYNSVGGLTLNISAVDGSVTISGTGVITGGSYQTAASNPRVVLDSVGLHAYDAGGSQQVFISASSGFITCTGVINSQPGSTVPWQTTGFYVGGGNLLNNSSAEDPTTTTQILYFSTGGSVTAGSFTLKYGSSSATAAINWNSTAASAQTAINAVMPAGTSVTCSGGPLPGTPITITFNGFAPPVPPPSILTVNSQALTGGSVLVGADPVAWSGQSLNIVGGVIGVTDFITYSSAFHGGSVLRLTSLVTGSQISTTQTLGPWAPTPGGTSYTLSAYLRSPVQPRNGVLTITWLDAVHNPIATSTVTTSWVTSTSSWQRAVLTGLTPTVDTRQQISITGGPTGGTFKLTYNGQQTAAIAYNATAAQVASALQALSNVGTSGCPTIYATGGPLPGTAVYVSFISPPAALPAPLTHVDSLTGGASPTVHVASFPTVYLLVAVGVTNATASEIHYVDAVQLEVGDVPAAYAPRPDEIVADQIVANMINVVQISALAADLGVITAGSLSAVTVTSSTITGGTIQTSASNPRVTLTSTGLQSYDSGGNATVGIGGGVLTIVSPATQSFGFPTAASACVNWQDGSAILISNQTGYRDGFGTSYVASQAFAEYSNKASVAALIAYDDLDQSQSYIYATQSSRGNAEIKALAGIGNPLVTITDFATRSSFVQLGAVMYSKSGSGTFTWSGSSRMSNRVTTTLRAGGGAVGGVAVANYTPVPFNGNVPAAVYAVGSYSNGDGTITFVAETVDGSTPSNGSSTGFDFLIWGF